MNRNVGTLFWNNKALFHLQSFTCTRINASILENLHDNSLFFQTRLCKG